MIRYVRFHGRGGQGVKLACRILGRAAFLGGATVQDSPLYGAERRGAPVVAFARIADEPIRERGYVSSPDAVIVLDDSLLDDAEAGVRDGQGPESLVLVNSPRRAEEARARWGLDGEVVSWDLSAIAIEVIGAHVLSAVAAALAAKAGALAAWPALAEAIRVELEDAGIDAAAIERNWSAARRVFDAVPVAGRYSRSPSRRRSSPAPFVFPALGANLAAPTIVAAATSLLRRTDGWRVERPVIEPARCTRCMLCFVLCPEGAIALGPGELPEVDYAHCKGCMICARECPTGAIHAVSEAAP